MEKNQKKWKKILALILKYPFITASLIVAPWLYLVTPYQQSIENNNDVCVVYFVIGVVFWFFIGIILLFQQNKYIKYSEDDDSFLIKYFDNKTAEIGNLFWGTKNIYEITKPKLTSNYKNNTKWFHVSIKISYQHGYSQTIIPITAKIIVENNYNPWEIYNKLILNDIFSVYKFVEKTLLDTIKAKNKVLSEAAEKFKNGELSAGRLMETINEHLDFPQLLDNLKITEIHLSQPYVEAVKENR